MRAYKEVEARALAAEQRVEVVPDGDARELLGGDVGGAKCRERAGAKGGVGEVEEVGESEAERRVPEELEPLVGGRGVGEGLVRERLLQEGAVAELVAQQALHARRGLLAVGHEARRRELDGQGGAGRRWRWSRRATLAGVVRRRHGILAGRLLPAAVRDWGDFAEVLEFRVELGTNRRRLYGRCRGKGWNWKLKGGKSARCARRCLRLGIHEDEADWIGDVW